MLLISCLAGCNEEEKKKANEAAESYNSQVEEYNNNVIQIGDLYDSVNSRVAKPNSMIEE